jgi:PAS domain S-box-containing protein
MWFSRSSTNKNQELQYRVIFDLHPQPMWVYDLESLQFLAVNDAATLEYGYTREEFLQMTLKDIRPSDEHDRLEDSLKNSKHGQQRSGIWRHLLKDGRTISVDIASNSIEFNGRNARLVIAKNVTEQIELQKRLLESEERFRAVSQVTTDVIWDWTLGDDRTWYSEGMETIFGNSAESGADSSHFWVNRIHPEDKDRVLQSTNRAIRDKVTKWHDQYRFIRRDGSVAYVEDSAYIIADAGGAVVRMVGGMTDVSQRVAAEAQLSQQAALLEKAQDAISVRDLSQKVLFWNGSAARIYGWRKQEVVGRYLSDLFSIEPTLLDEPTSTTLIHGEWAGTLEHTRKDGTKVIVEARWTLVRDEDGAPSSILAIETDITKSSALEEELRQSQRLEAIGQLTGGIAHDFNNLLTVILGNSELLADQMSANDPLRPLAVMAKTAAERGAALISKLLLFARRQPLQVRAVNINDTLVDMEDLLRRTLSANISVRQLLDDRVGETLIDPTQFEAAILNLCINARDAMPNGGKLTIETKAVELSEGADWGCQELARGDYVLVSVSDTGHGIPEHLLARVFEPFFTTKDVGKGTGLGLSMVYGFVKQSHGHVQISSETGQGTKIKLYLPKLGDQTIKNDDGKPIGKVARGDGRILVVEDEALVRHHVCTLLTAIGYDVVAVENGAEAVNMLRDGDCFDLLFTDVMMPGPINGAELAKTARQLRPDLPVLFTSGYSDGVITPMGPSDAGVLMLSKPYSRADLVQKVRTALRRGSGRIRTVV